MKTILATLLILPVMASAATKVTLSEAVSMEVDPDTMRTTLSFEERASDEQRIRSHFNTLVRSVKRYNERDGLECRGGSYRIAPQYSWTDNRRNFLGYQGSVAFQCTFRDIGSFNALSAELDTVAGGFPDVKRNQGTVDWIVSDDLALRSREALEGMLIRRIERKREHLGSIMQKSCTTESIAFGSRPPAYPVRRMMAAESMAASPVPIEEPIQGESEVSLSATVEFSCE